MTTQTEVYNLAALQLRESSFTDLSENRESRYVFDTLWDNVRKDRLEAGYWKFALRSVQLSQDTAITPAFGYPYAHDRPSDWVKTYLLSLSEFFEPLLDDYIEESTYFYANSTPLYLRYVSNLTTGYGGDLSVWTSRFTKAVAFELAFRAAPKVSGTSDQFLGVLGKESQVAISSALAFEAMREPPKRLSEGNWVRSGRGNGRGRADWWRFAP